MLTPSAFLAEYDEFQTLSEPKIQSAILQAIVYCPLHAWGELHSQAVFLVTAHILAMRWLQVGAIAASSVQNAKGRDASNRMDSDSWLTGTTWGQQFLQLRQGLPVCGFVA
ncbi:MAG: DUF4054 domain-containing protein [Cyanobacteriota bacterium]